MQCKHKVWPKAKRFRRQGKVLVLIAILLPVLIAIIGLILDGALLTHQHQSAQHVADAAATLAAMEVLRGSDATDAADAARSSALQQGVLNAPAITVNIPPTSGAFTGQAGFAEVVIADNEAVHFMPALGYSQQQPLCVRAVAGVEDSTTGAAVVILDQDPADFAVSPIPPILPALPTLVGGLEVLGLGRVRVDGSVLVNTNWGGVDENSEPAGPDAGPPYSISCTSILPLTKLLARDIRVAGGVDSASNYGAFAASDGQPLKANALPVPDPFAELPVPTLSADSVNVSSDYHGGVRVVGLPLIGPPVTLQPGVYDWIEVVSGVANFEPGVYIIRGANPLTQISLNLLAGTIHAEGVMFYITNNAAYDPGNGQPDAADGETPPSPPAIPTLIPSVVINSNLLDSDLTALNSPGSPFDGMLIYQRRHDRRPIVIAHTNLLGGDFAGTTYAKWGHVILIGQGTYDARFVAGTMRILALIDVTLSPSDLLPPAQDIFLVE
jgi:Flp pilus assembly protein TadG